MKKYLLAILILSFSNARSQDVSFNIRAGVSYAGLRGETMNQLITLADFTNGIVSSGNHTGFFAGISTSIPAGNNFSFEPGIYFSQKGSELKGVVPGKAGELTGASAKAVLAMNYVDAPLLLKFHAGGFEIFAGPQLSYLTQASLRTTAGVLGVNLLNHTADATSFFNKWDAAVVAGAGYQFSNGLNLTVSLDRGLLKADANRNAGVYNQSVKIGLGVRF